MKKLGFGIVLVVGFLATAASPPSRGRLGLRCVGHVTKPFDGSRDESHYIVDFDRRKIVLRDPVDNKAIATYPLRVEERRYVGESISDGRTNGGLPIHHYETIYISRENGSVETNSLSTTSFPSGPSSSEMAWQGTCIRENPDQRTPLKF